MAEVKSEKVRPASVWTVRPIMSPEKPPPLPPGRLIPRVRMDNSVYYENGSDHYARPHYVGPEYGRPDYAKLDDSRRKEEDAWSEPESSPEEERRGRTVHLMLVALCVLLLILFVMIISMSYLAFRVNQKTYTTDQDMFELDDDEGVKIVEGQIRITNWDYTDELKDENSEKYKNLAFQIKQSMDAVFLHSVQHYNHTNVLGYSFGEGNVVAKCQIEFSKARMDATHKVGLSIIDALERYHGYLPGGMLQVDIRSLCFTGLREEDIDPDPVVVPDVVELPRKSGTWSQWSEWSICAPCERQTRYRKCIDTFTPCAGNEQETRTCLCDLEEASNQTVVMECNGDCPVGQICIYLHQTPYARCVVPRDDNDPSGCGGWCPGYHQVCRSVAPRTVQCALVPPCKTGEWQCSNGLCIRIADICNGHDDCLDLSDELNCICPAGQFRCGENTRCLSDSRKCDGKVDCWDGRDEVNCSKVCPAGQFRCGEFTPCIPDSYKCDGKVDCWDARDEVNCTKSCPSGKFTCNNGMCVDMKFFCDHYPDCSDGTDEPKGCNDPCLPMQRECNNGRCIHETYWCDGADDCLDGSDEKSCPRRSPFRPK